MRYDTKADVDLGHVAAESRKATVLAAFDRMAAGDSILVDGPQPPIEVLRALQNERRGQFDWAPVDHPPCWRIELSRRPGPAGPRLADTLAWEHTRLAELQRLVLAAIRANDLPEARHHFVIFERRLNRHIHFEEEVLFPEFERRAGPNGPTAVMRAEHREIRMMLEHTGRALYGTRTEAEEECVSLLARLDRHDFDEEAAFYGCLESLLTADESAALVGRVQEFA
jgi:uncharacterized protein (DUF2249 family)/hemerythrin-like domain-containing protein